MLIMSHPSSDELQTSHWQSHTPFSSPFFLIPAGCWIQILDFCCTPREWGEGNCISRTEVWACSLVWATSLQNPWMQTLKNSLGSNKSSPPTSKSKCSSSSHTGRQLKAVTQPLAQKFYVMSNCRGMGSLGIFMLLNSFSEEIFAVLYKTCIKKTCWSLARAFHCPGVWLQKVWGVPDTDGRNSHSDFSQQNGSALSQIGKSWTGKGRHWLPGKRHLLTGS